MKLSSFSKRGFTRARSLWIVEVKMMGGSSGFLRSSIFNPPYGASTKLNHYYFLMSYEFISKFLESANFSFET